MIKLKKINVYTNGISKFTLEDYSFGACEAYGIKLHSFVDEYKKRAMHEHGQIVYVSGIGDRKELAGVKITRKSKFENFKCW